MILVTRGRFFVFEFLAFVCVMYCLVMCRCFLVMRQLVVIILWRGPRRQGGRGSCQAGPCRQGPDLIRGGSPPQIQAR